MGKNLQIGIVGLGWLGESLATHLKDENHTVWGTVRGAEKKERIEKTGIQVVQWENPLHISEEFQLALGQTELLIMNLPPSVFKEKTYAAGLSSIIQYLSKNCRVIFTSSTGVYPDHLEEATEDYIFEEEESNALLEAEKVLAQQLKEKLCILRLAGLIGEDRNPVFYLAKKETNTDPNRRVNLIHRKDIIRVISKIINEDFFGEIFNVSHPEHPTRKEYYSHAAQHFKLGNIQFENSDHDTPNKRVISRKLQNMLNYTTFETLM